MNKFTNVMAKKTDAELLKILANDNDGYVADALVAAEEEFKKRNLSSEELQDAKKINTKLKDIEEKIADEPLEDYLKALVLFYPLKAILSSGLFYNQGYKRKSEEIVTWGYYGLAFYFSIFFLIWLFSQWF
jgi:hypothetical protein